MNLIDRIPPLLTDKELIKALSKQPHFDSNMPLTKSERLLRLLDIYDIYIPTKMSTEIYNTIYFSLVRSYQRKSKLYAEFQMNQNRRVINGASITSGVNGGDCSLLVGESGLGKSQSIKRVVDIISYNSVIEIDNPYCSIIPILVVEASPTVSIKGFFFEILRVIDNILGTNYYQSNNRTTINNDMLLGSVSNALLLHCGCLIIDEVDRLVNNKKSITYVNYITQLINMCGVSVIFVGTPKSLEFFQQTEYLARRSMGCVYRAMPYGDEYYNFCNQLFHYQYTTYQSELNSELMREFFKYTNGNIAETVQLFVETQKWAINNDYERIDTHSINKAFSQSMSIMTPFIEFKKTTLPPPHYTENISIPTKEKIIIENDSIFSTLPLKSDKDIEKAISILSQSIKVEVIQI